MPLHKSCPRPSLQYYPKRFKEQSQWPANTYFIPIEYGYLPKVGRVRPVMQPSDLTTPELRHRAVAFAVTLASGTSLAPLRYERELLALFEAGTLTLDELSDLLECSVYQVLYHSRARDAPTDAQLRELLTQSQAHNARQGITGLLLYSDGRYVQVLEGPGPAVRALYARIQRDPRHAQVVTVSAGPGPRRWFADWSMDFGQVTAPEMDPVLAVLLGAAPPPGCRVADSRLQALLTAFGHPAAGALARQQLQQDG